MKVLEDIRRIATLIAPVRGKYALGLSALMLVNLSDVVAPLFLALAIELTQASLTGGAPETPTPLALLGLDGTAFSIGAAVAIFLALQINASVFRYPMLMKVAVPSHQVGQNLRRALADRLLRQSQSWYDGKKSGDLMSIGTADIMAVRMMLGPGILVGADTFMLVSMVFAVLSTISLKLTLITLIPMPLITIITRRLSEIEYRGFEAVQEDLGWMTERVRESYAGIRIIQGYAREAFDRARFRDFSLRHYEKNLRLARVRATFDPTFDLMLGVSTALVLVFGGAGVLDGSISTGAFVAFLFLIRYLSGPMTGLGWSISLFQRGRASLGRIDELLAEPIDVLDGDREWPDPKGRVTFRNVSFTYPVAKPVDEDAPADLAHQAGLHDVSFEIPAGKNLGIFGPVGSGKSTIVSLLSRLYDPPRGTVFVDGIDVRDLQLDALRRNVVLAPQETFLFSTTVSRNIGMGVADDEITEARVADFARLAHLHNDVEQFQEGYETLLGEKGVNLSGGQRQRLAIARAIGADPRVIVLDDCLSAVDASTEAAILENLRTVLEGRTGIVVSHRVRAVQACDEIIVVEGGRVTARGDHDTLLRTSPYYAAIAAEQTRDEHAKEAS